MRKLALKPNFVFVVQGDDYSVLLFGELKSLKNFLDSLGVVEIENEEMERVPYSFSEIVRIWKNNDSEKIDLYDQETYGDWVWKVSINKIR